MSARKMWYSFVKSCSGSFLRPDTPNSPREVQVCDDCFPAEDWIGSQVRDMLSAHHDAALGIHCEPAHRSRHRTGQAELARWIKKQKHALADAVALTAGPKASPFVNG